MASHDDRRSAGSQVLPSKLPHPAGAGMRRGLCQTAGCPPGRSSVRRRRASTERQLCKICEVPSLRLQSCAAICTFWAYKKPCPALYIAPARAFHCRCPAVIGCCGSSARGTQRSCTGYKTARPHLWALGERRQASRNGPLSALARQQWLVHTAVSVLTGRQAVEAPGKARAAYAASLDSTSLQRWQALGCCCCGGRVQFSGWFGS
jgi:hypothetical protein